jgi:two-component system chemotaxis sensor kinase CheA
VPWRILRPLGSTDGDIETVHAVFRAVHSIKGGAGAFGLEDLVTFAHLFETVLDEMRGGKMTIAEGVMHVLLRAGDMLSDLVACARDGVAPDAERMGQLLAELDALADGGGGDDDQAPFEFVPTVLSVEPMDLAGPGGIERSDPAAEEPTVSTWRIGFAPSGELYGTGNEPLALLRALEQLGALTVDCEDAAVAALAEFDPAQPRLRWVMTLATSASRDEIEAVFEFVADVADVSLEMADDVEATAPDIDATRSAQNSASPAQPDLLSDQDAANGRSAARIADAPEPATNREGRDTQQAPPVSIAQRSAPDTPGPAQPSAQQSAATPATIRVNLDRVDRLINLIGELVIMEAMLSQAVESAGLASDSDVSNGLDGIKQLASGIQESVMAIRAQPLKPVFQRMHRIIREAADATGKAGSTRHGRRGDGGRQNRHRTACRPSDPHDPKLGRPWPRGDASERSGHRQAGNRDDHPVGAHIDPAASSSRSPMTGPASTGEGSSRSPRKRASWRPVRRSARGKSTISCSHPGFSSKDEVSALSGRGVGLDVVRREIQALGGRVTIQSTAGEGTTFTIALPLTLAVLEGMLVEFGGEMMVLPLSAILETLRPSSATIHSIGRTGRVVANRGELIPIIDLADAFGVSCGRSTRRNAMFSFWWSARPDAGRRLPWM